eukprot:3569193-Rhodomonas_salina.1
MTLVGLPQAIRGTWSQKKRSVFLNYTSGLAPTEVGLLLKDHPVIEPPPTSAPTLRRDQCGRGGGGSDRAGESDESEEREGATAPMRSACERRGRERWRELD